MRLTEPLRNVLARLKDEFSFLQGNFLVLVISWILMNFAAPIASTYYALYVEELGGSGFIIGIIQFASFAALALVQFPGGYLADKHGRRWLIVTMTFGVALSTLFYATAPSWHFILLGAVLQSFCLIYQPALGAITMDSLKPEKRGMGYSIQILLRNIAALPAPLIAGFLLHCFNEDLVLTARVAYFIATAFYLAAAVLRFRLQETLKNKAARPSAKEILTTYRTTMKAVFAVWKDVPKSVIYLIVGVALADFFFMMCAPYFLLYATNILHIEKSQWPLVLVCSSVGSIVSAIPAGKIADIFGRKIPLVVSYALTLPILGLFMYGNLPMLFVSFTLLGISSPLARASYTSLQADLVPQQFRGKVIGCTQFFFYIFMGISGVIGGYLFDYVSPQLPYILALASTVPSIVVLAFLVHEPEQKET